MDEEKAPSIESIVNYTNEKIDELCEKYAIQEKKTNKIWIDNKPIYKKVFEITTTSGNNNIDVSDLNIDWVVKLEGQTKQSNSNNFCGFYILDDTNKCNCYYRAGDNKIRIDCGTSYGFGAMKIIIEYTKTTD